MLATLFDNWYKKERQLHMEEYISLRLCDDICVDL